MYMRFAFSVSLEFSYSPAVLQNEDIDIWLK